MQEKVKQACAMQVRETRRGIHRAHGASVISDDAVYNICSIC